MLETETHFISPFRLEKLKPGTEGQAHTRRVPQTGVRLQPQVDGRGDAGATGNDALVFRFSAVRVATATRTALGAIDPMTRCFRERGSGACETSCVFFWQRTAAEPP